MKRVIILQGKLQIYVITMIGSRPVQNAAVRVYITGEPDNPLYQLTTNESGMTDELELDAPDIAYSTSPSEPQPYAEYTVDVNAEGYEPTEVSSTELLPDSNAILVVRLTPLEENQLFSRIVIPPHTLFGNYPPKIAEPEITESAETGEIVLNRVVIPEYIVVHDGVPTDTTAQNYWVRYRDYIKNVASSEIYATWTDAAIRANILAIMSFTLNRVFTEFYRNKGYDFTITSSTAFDHKFIYGRNIFESISDIVDEMFGSYLARPGIKQPILTQYCDGQRVTCPNWMSQWGSQDLGKRGYSTSEILRYYYGDTIYIANAEEVSGVPSSYPGYDLEIGSYGDSVLTIQEQLNTISDSYPAIPKVAEDGIYGEGTANAVRTFQDIFNLPETGVVDYRTWYRISEIYVAVTRLAELV
ncbi:MAG: peptidoglycan-binding protein [Lachnospiraceae bacterium]|nr:peptidoglycan-binding protein [Lachnospiraceae bacterium]